ncbi:MAG: GNAT family N-acetyltransferase [Candidatus Heimdallarchaeota archaeon]
MLVWGCNLEENYYLRDLTQTDWEKFQAIDKLIFPDDLMSMESFFSSLSGMNALSVVIIHKETKDFIGYFKISNFGTLGHVTRIGTHPDYRGKGYGSILVEKSMYYLKKRGCNKYYLYVLENNSSAIELYKKHGFTVETESYQYTVPKKHFLEKVRGRCRHVEWGEIQMTSLRFNLNPFQIQQYFSRENQHVLIYEVMGQQIGFCRFDPNYPGAMPFKLKDPSYIVDFISILNGYITDKKVGDIKITIDGQENLIQKLNEEKIPLNRKLLRMTRPSELEKKNK